MTFGQEFQDDVAEVTRRPPDPRAKAFGVVPVIRPDVSTTSIP